MKGPVETLFRNPLYFWWGGFIKTLKHDVPLFPYLYSDDNNKLFVQKQPRQLISKLIDKKAASLCKQQLDKIFPLER